MTPISVIIHAHNAAMHLERSLPLLLQQDYPCYEVVVVVDNCTDSTLERLEQQELLWPLLRHIEVPTSAIHHDRHSLAMMLGVRSARYDWVLMLQPDFAPVSMQWLSRMAEGIGSGTARVMGYTTIESGGFAQYLYAHEQMLTMAMGEPGVEDSNVLVQRDAWLQGGRIPTVSMKHPEARVVRSASFGTWWWDTHLSSVRRHNASRVLSFRLVHAGVLWMPVALLAASVAVGILTWWWLGLAVYIVWIAFHTTLLYRYCRSVGEHRFLLSHCLYSLALPFLLRR